ncbi:MAG: type II toxin-antitoxin system RelE/ParE family toxin [Desulfurivibrionaceae bacterium]
MRIIWSPLAVERAAEISDYIARDNPAAAVKWIETIFKKVGQLTLSPQSGRVVPEVNDTGIRELIYWNYRIIYRVEDKRISMLTIRHGKQILPIDEISEIKNYKGKVDLDIDLDSLRGRECRS